MPMSQKLSVRATSRTKSRRQAFALLLFGVICLAAAWFLHPGYPLGVLVFGAGMLLASALNPFRLGIAGWLVTLLGVATFLFFGKFIPGNQFLSYYFAAIGVGLLGIAYMARRGYIGRGAVTPGLLVILAGILEYLLAANLTPRSFIPFMLSLWLPGFGLLILGVIYLLVSLRE